MKSEAAPKKVSSTESLRPKSKNSQPARAEQNLPAGLHGYSGWNKQKQRICYNFNMAHGCANKVTKDNNFDKCKPWHAPVH